MAAIRKLNAVPSDLIRYSPAEGNVHLFLLTSQLDDRAIDLLLEVLMGQIKFRSLVLDPCSDPITR